MYSTEKARRVGFDTYPLYSILEPYYAGYSSNTDTKYIHMCTVRRARYDICMYTQE